MLMGRDTTAIERGAMDAYHPAALRLIPKVSIKSGIRGPAEAQFIPRHERMRTIIPSITNRYRLLLFKEGSFYPTISDAVLNDTPIEYSVSNFQVADICRTFIFSLHYTPIELVLSVVMQVFSRKHEYEAKDIRIIYVYM
jgi:hypothetical protein